MRLESAPFTDGSIVSGFFNRQGGASGGIYVSLNCGYGSDDEPDNVTENRVRVCRDVGFSPDTLLTVHQIHSPDCVTVVDPWQRGHAPKADAMATDRAGLLLGILTADCGPVLFKGRKADGSAVIGAAHAGWGGAVRGVIESTVVAMVALGADAGTIEAAIGPCIGRESYEVSDGFETPFLDHDPRAVRFFQATKPGHALFDLTAYIAFRAQNAGVRIAFKSGRDTCALEDDFFSYRRGCRRGEPDYGRQISVIGIRSQISH